MEVEDVFKILPTAAISKWFVIREHMFSQLTVINGFQFEIGKLSNPIGEMLRLTSNPAFDAAEKAIIAGL